MANFAVEEFDQLQNEENRHLNEDDSILVMKATTADFAAGIDLLVVIDMIDSMASSLLCQRVSLCVCVCQ